MSDLTRKLRVEFSTRDAFLREYNINLANGGIFVSTLDAFEVNSPVIVELDLKYCETRIEFEGEVVHCISPERSGTGGNAGVAVQISTPVSELREALEESTIPFRVAGISFTVTTFLSSGLSAPPTAASKHASFK